MDRPATPLQARRALKEGLRHFQGGRYFEAHEAWELLWKRLSPGQAREGLQGWIQVAGVLELVRKGRKLTP